MHLETAFAAISFSYQNRMAFALEQHRAGVPLVGFTSNTVPWELIRASGAFPILVSPAATPALSEPDIERWMEPTFDSRIRAIFHATLKGDWSFLKLLVIHGHPNRSTNCIYTYAKWSAKGAARRYHRFIFTTFCTHGRFAAGNMGGNGPKTSEDIWKRSPGRRYS